MKRKVPGFHAVGAIGLLALDACIVGFDGDQYTRGTATTLDVDGGSETRSDAGSREEGGAAACSADVRFGTPVRALSADLGDEEYGLSLLADQLSGFVSATTGGQKDLFAVRRETVTDPLRVVGPLSVNTPGEEEAPSVTADGLVLFFHRVNPSPARIFVTSRASVEGTWSAPEVVATLVTDAGVAEPHVSASRLYHLGIYDGSSALFAATRAGSTVTGPQRIAELDTNDNEHSAVPSADDGTLYFARFANRDPNDYEIMVATRAASGPAFGTPRKVTELNSAKTDMPAFLSPDGCTLYFSSSRSGTSRLYVARRSAG